MLPLKFGANLILLCPISTGRTSSYFEPPLMPCKVHLPGPGCGHGRKRRLMPAILPLLNLPRKCPSMPAV